MSIEDAVQSESRQAGTYINEGNRMTKREVQPEAGKDPACADLSRECFAQSAQSVSNWIDRFHCQLDARLSKLFDGDKPLEITGGKKESKEQKWLVVMNMAVDFGGECTIEKREKKLQELASKTEGKDVTIVVQAAARNEETGKYELDRFVLKDGKIEKLKSPGESKGYGNDVESLLKYATDTYKTKNLGLILDSHGNGNEGLIGDNGNISMPELKTHLQTALKGSGHEKLDFLQFDACLMAQNGVLDATRGLADHIVASAEPEGVTADTAAADNKNLEQLLKDPSMTPDQLAEWCVKEAKDVDGFDTLAHFDMAKYDAFRKTLDDFGEQLNKLWADPKQQEALREIISKTFEYGGGGGGGAIFDEIFHAVTGKDNPVKPEKPAEQTECCPDAPKPENKPSVEQILDYLREKPLFSIMPLSEMPAFSRTLERPKRDLKDFVEKVVAAIDAGKLKDDDHKLREAAEKVLKDGSSLTKSFFGRGDHKGLGGLSVYLPEAGDGSILSSSGAWRQFQEQVRVEEKAAKAKKAK